MEILKLLKMLTLKLLYFTIGRSYVEFDSIVWSSNAVYINQVKNVQYKFLKLICLSIHRKSYNL